MATNNPGSAEDEVDGWSSRTACLCRKNDEQCVVLGAGPVFFSLCCPRKGFPVLHGRLAKGGIMVLCTPQGGTMSLLNVDSREKLVIFGKIDNFAAKNQESKKSFSHN